MMDNHEIAHMVYTSAFSWIAKVFFLVDGTKPEKLKSKGAIGTSQMRLQLPPAIR
jgi:hypothetical protein